MTPSKDKSTRHAVPTADGALIHLESFVGETTGYPPVLMAPAMGAPAGSLRNAAQVFQLRGFPVILFDHRGSGADGLEIRRGIDFGVNELLSFDWPAAIDWVAAAYPDHKPVLFGHSLGGQLNSIYAGLNPSQIGALVNLCAVWIHFRSLGPIGNQIGGLSFYLLMRALANVLGYAPGDKLGWGARFPKQLIRDWSSWGLFGTYAYKGGAGGKALREAALPTLAISFSDDRRLGAKPACDRFCEQMDAANITRWHLRPEDLGAEQIGHFGALKGADEFWERVADWIEESAVPTTISNATLERNTA